MPGGDGTGPVGAGSMTGRAAGICAGYGVPGYAHPMPGRGFGPGRGMGYGRGWGRGRRRWAGYDAWGPTAYGPVTDRNEELDMLKAQAEQMQNGLAQVQERIHELEKSANTSK